MGKHAYHRLHAEAPFLAIVRKVLLVLLSIHVVLASISGDRALVQIHSVDVHASDRTLQPGTSLTSQVVSYGRTWTTLRLILLQGSRAETLGVVRVPPNYN